MGKTCRKRNMVEQGDIIQIENINDLALVISKNQYNESEKAILCR